jgi:hypothetical protein
VAVIFEGDGQHALVEVHVEDIETEGPTDIHDTGQPLLDRPVKRDDTMKGVWD